MKRATPVWPLLLLPLLATTCRQQPRQAFELLPADALLVARVPDLAAAAAHLDVLLDKLAQGPARLFFNQFRREVRRRLGFAPRSAEQWRKLGVDPAAGLTGGLLADGQGVLVLGVSDRAALSRALTSRMKELAAADQVTSQRFSGVEVITLSTLPGTAEAARLRLAFAGRFVLLAGPGIGAERLAALAGLQRESSLPAAGWFEKLRGRLPAQADLLLASNPTAPTTLAQVGDRTFGWPEQGAALALRLGPRCLAAHLFFGLAAPRAARYQGLVVSAPDSHLEDRLPASSLLVLKLRANPRKLLAELSRLRPESVRKIKGAGKSLEKRLGRQFLSATIDNLTGNLVLGAGLNSGGGPGRSAGLDSSGGGEPEQAGWLMVWAELRKPQLLRQLLADLHKKAGPAFPSKQRRLGSLEITELTTPRGRRLSVLLGGNLAGLCLGKSCQQLAADSLAGEAGNLAAGLVEPARAQLDRANPVAGLLRLDRLLDSISSLDDSRLAAPVPGMKALLQLVKGVLGGLGELGMALELQPAGGVLRVNLWLR